MNPFTTASLSKWLARPAKESMALTRPLANSDPRDSFLNLQAAALIASPARGDSRSTAALIESQIQRDRESDFTRYGNRDRSLTSPELGKRRGECSVVGAAAADAFGLTPQRALSSGDRSAAGGIRIGSSRGSGQFQRRSRTTEAAQTDYLGRWDIPWSSVELERKTGSGGSGQVFAAKFDGARVAAKELYSQKMSGSLVELSREVREDGSTYLQLHPHTHTYVLVYLPYLPFHLTGLHSVTTWEPPQCCRHVRYHKGTAAAAPARIYCYGVGRWWRSARVD